ncbi:hypothetical protein [Oerskovia paurometabola]|uniref:hypothetical protein n=1 Tax=Oerskovia paurometabola TaxID=162170 RepID=UPI003422BE1C
MRSRSGLVIGALFVTLSVTGCAAPAPASAPVSVPAAGDDGDGGPATPGPVAVTSSGEATSAPGADGAAARERAQAWLDAAVVPPGAIRSDSSVATFTSFTGWSCGPVEELEAFWKIPGATVSETANWLRENPTADLVTTAWAPVPDDPPVDSAMVGNAPASSSHEGVVYTVMRTGDGVAVRAEIAALVAPGPCAPPPGGGTWGAPGQG